MNTSIAALNWTKSKAHWILTTPKEEGYKVATIPAGNFVSNDWTTSTNHELLPTCIGYDTILDLWPNVEIDPSIDQWYIKTSIHNSRMYKLLENRDPLPFEREGLHLRSYQRGNVRYLAKAQRALVCDELGLGKTITALMTVEYLRKQSTVNQPFRTLIVVVGDLKYQWIEEIDTWWQESKIFDMAGVPKAKRYQAWLEFLASEDPYTVGLVTWGSLRLMPEVPKYKIRVLIADEAHAAKDRTAKQTQALTRMCARIPNVYLMTGTPLEKSPADLWSLLHIINPKRFASYWRFFYAFVDFVRFGPNGEYTKYLGTQSVARPALAEILQSCYIRRTREVELTEVKDPQLIFLPCKLSPAQMKLHKEVEKEPYIERLKLEIPNGVARVLRLRQVATCPYVLDETLTPVEKQGKLKVLQSLLTSLDNTVQTVIFTSFRKSVSYIDNLLGDKSLEFLAGNDDRHPNLERFKSGEVPYLVSTPQSLGVGANLQNASCIIFMDLPLSYRLYKQCIGRVVRMGQSGQPLIYHITAEKTVDGLIKDLIQNKQTNFDQTVITNLALRELCNYKGEAIL